MEQDALNSLVRGDFAPLSPRYNFMGDFFLTGLEAEIAPIVLHFVNQPKPWHYAGVARRSAVRAGLRRLVRRFAVPAVASRRRLRRRDASRRRARCRRRFAASLRGVSREPSISSMLNEALL